MRSLIKEDSGSYSLEAALIFPVILVVVIALLLFAGYTYEKTVLYGAAVAYSEQAAFMWDNSSRDAKSGLAAAGQYDSLYWRIGEDGMLQSLFGLAGSEREETRVEIGGGHAENEEEADRSGSLADRKLIRTAVLLSGAGSIQGELRYDREVITRRITAVLRLPGEVPLLTRWLGRSEPASSASAAIVEPTEFIRTVDLVRYYTSRFGNGSGSTAQLRQAGSAIQATASNKSNG